MQPNRDVFAEIFDREWGAVNLLARTCRAARAAVDKNRLAAQWVSPVPIPARSNTTGSVPMLPNGVRHGRADFMTATSRCSIEYVFGTVKCWRADEFAPSTIVRAGNAELYALEMSVQSGKSRRRKYLFVRADGTSLPFWETSAGSGIFDVADGCRQHIYRDLTLESVIELGIAQWNNCAKVNRPSFRPAIVFGVDKNACEFLGLTW